MKTLLIIFLILLFVLLLPVGVDGGYQKNALILGIKIGPLNIKLFPRRKKEVKAEKPEKKEKIREAESNKKPEKEKDKPDLKEILELVKLGLRVPGQFRRKLSVDYLRFRCILAMGDPFSTAVYFGAASAAIEAVFPIVDNAFNIKKRDFGIAPDFLADKTELDIWLTATVHVLDLFHIAAAFGIEYLKLKIRQKRSKPKSERNETNG